MVSFILCVLMQVMQVTLGLSHIRGEIFHEFIKQIRSQFEIAAVIRLKNIDAC